jgi:hypothetical protein
MSTTADQRAAAIARGVARLNAEEYREALLAFEEAWHADRADGLRALIQLSNALNQLRLGLVTGPRRNLDSAAALLASCPPHWDGLETAELLAAVRAARAAIPDGAETGGAAVAWATVPRPRIAHEMAASQ